MGLALDPAVIALLLGAEALYVRAVRVLRRRGRPVPRWQQAAWHGGIALMAGALVSPVDPLAEDLLSAHMVQHLMIADLAAPLLLAGMRTPVLQHYLPPALLAPLARAHGLRRALAVLARPLVSVPVYIVVLYGWHLSFAFEGALRHPVVHVLQHQSFIAISMLIWWPALEPNRARVGGELWKAGHILGVRVSGMMLGMGFVFSRTPLYADFYGAGPRRFGIGPLLDQQIGGGLMFAVDLAIMLGAFAFFFWRAAEDHDRAEALAAARATPGPRPAPR